MDINKAYDLILEKIDTWFKDTVKLLPNIILAAIIVVLGLYISKILKKYAYRFINKVSTISTINKLFASFVQIVVIAVTIFTALDILNLDKAVTTALTGAGILGLALAFAFQDIAANLMSGIFMSFRRPFNIGDLVKIKDNLGRVEGINLRDTTIITLTGQRLIIPNKEVFQNTIENYTSTDKRRLDLEVGVSYGDDLEKVRVAILEATKDFRYKAINKDVEFFYNEFSDSSINFNLRVWLTTTEQSNYLAAKSELIMLVKATFDQHNFTIPFPITTLDFGIKGGLQLSEVLKIDKA